jgi:3-deoxy-D-manno-octulosonate 8-phosphate phosphatase (KDO 8-P phosphatase)
MPIPPDEITSRAGKIRLLLTDCDGVLTDGSLYYTADGKRVFEITKVFASPSLAARAREMQIDHLHQGIGNKLAVYEQIQSAEGLTDEQIAYIGDDLPDLCLMRRVGLSIAVADAVAEVRQCAHYQTDRRGGRGAVREAIEMILKAQGKWDELVRRYE